MKFDVYVADFFIDTVEAESEEELADAAWELCTEWLNNSMYWEPTEEEE